MIFLTFLRYSVKGGEQGWSNLTTLTLNDFDEDISGLAGLPKLTSLTLNRLRVDGNLKDISGLTNRSRF